MNWTEYRVFKIDRIFNSRKMMKDYLHMPWNATGFLDIKKNNSSTSSVMNGSGIPISGYETAGFGNPFSSPFVRAMFITCYTIVFVFCVFGNLMVLFAIVRSPRLKSNTNFFLANLAMADFCVGLFCVLPNLSTFLNPTWILSEAMCKIYYYIWNVSYIASIFILTVIAVERYSVIMHPLNSRHFMTRFRVKIIQKCIWIIALIYNIPYAILYETLSVGKDNFCYATEDNEIKLKWLSVSTLVLWYIIPLFVIVILYYRIARALWKIQVVSALRLSTYQDNDTRCVITSSAFCPVLEHNEHTRETDLSNRSSLTGRSNVKQVKERYHLVQVASTRWVAKARQKVIRLLLCVVVTFAVCVFPHMMKVFDHYWAVFNISHSAMLILSPISFLILYLNSALNPFLYAMFSTNFRKSFKEVIPTFCQGLFKAK